MLMNNFEYTYVNNKEKEKRREKTLINYSSDEYQNQNLNL